MKLFLGYRSDGTIILKVKDGVEEEFKAINLAQLRMFKGPFFEVPLTLLNRSDETL